MNSSAIAVLADRSISEEIDELFAQFDVQRARAADRALRKLNDVAPSAATLEQLHRLCLLYAHYSKPVDGFTTARAAVRAARRIGDRHALRKALTARGALRRMAGDINGAIEDNVEAYKLARDLNDEGMLPAPVSNLVFVLGLIDLDDLALRLAEHTLARMPANPVTFPHLNAATSLMVNTSDLLLGRDPRRALRLACDAEQRLADQEGPMTASEQLQVATRVGSALINQVIAAINLGDRQLAAGAVDKLRSVTCKFPIPRLRHGSEAAFAAFEARYGDERRGLRELKIASDSGADEAAVDASRRLIEYFEAMGRSDEAAGALRSLQRRLQSIRRSVALEELRRIEALDEIAEFDECRAETERRLSSFAASANGASGRLSAKLHHLEGIAITAELREGSDMSRAGHAYRVGKLCYELAVEAGCSNETSWLAEIAGRLHDIGKCAIPDTTILSDAPLHEAMRAMLREHSDYGARLVADADEPTLVQVVAAIRHHHERFDGKGYPSSLAGNEIPLLARIVSICESYDAMLQSRVFRNSRTPAKALEEVERCAGTQFDPLLAGLFVRLVRRLQCEHGDIVEYLGSDAQHNAAVRTFEQLERLTAETRTVL